MLYSLGPTLALLSVILLLARPVAAQTPAATVEDGSGTVVLQSNTDGGLLVPGTFAFGTIPASGAGTRLMWHPGKAAFRAGRVNGAEWDDANIGHYSMAFGRQTEASGQSSMAMGNVTTASGDYSTAMGSVTAASGGWSTAMGSGTTASSAFSTAMGRSTTASGDYSTAMGQSTTASGDWSTAMGNSTTAEGPEATAMGRSTIASGSSSTAMGNGTTASGDYSTATGLQTTAASDHSLSIGRYNSANTTADNTLLVAGNGTSSTGWDALVLDRSGNLAIAGTLTESSDRRLKEAIRPLQENVLGRLGHIRPVHFRFKDERMHPSGQQLGLIAQEVQGQFPALVSEGSGGFLSVSYSKFTAVLLKGLQEQQVQIAALRSENEAIRQRLAKLDEHRESAPAGLGGAVPVGVLVGAMILGSFILVRRRWQTSRVATLVLLAGALTTATAVRAQTLTVQNGAVFTVDGTLDLGTGTVLVEADDARVAGSGTVTAVRTLGAPQQVDVGGLGAVITSDAALGVTRVTRGHTAQTAGGNAGIARYYDIEPATNTGLDATLTVSYHSAELNGLAEGNLVLYRSDDGGTTWRSQGGTVDASTSTITRTGIDGFSRWTVASSEQPLPVELITFEAMHGGDAVYLTWQTATETNNAGFEVQTRAEEGAWVKMDFVDGAGTTTEDQSYTYAARGLGPGTYNFRLRQVDFDGTAHYSDEVEVTLTLDRAFLVSQPYPNPARDVATLDLAVRERQHVTIALYDALGRRVAVLYDGELPANQMEHLAVQGDGLPSGHYLVHTAGETFDATRRVTLVR